MRFRDIISENMQINKPQSLDGIELILAQLELRSGVEPIDLQRVQRGGGFFLGEVSEDVERPECVVECYIFDILVATICFLL